MSSNCSFRLPRSRMIPNMVSAFRISRTSSFWISDHLFPFTVYKVFPYPDYYGDSVAIGLASRRRSRVPFSAGRIERDLGVPFISLNEVVLHRPPGEGYKSPNVLDLFLTASRYRRCSDERKHHVYFEDDWSDSCLVYQSLVDQ